MSLGAAPRALLPFAACALAREVDAALGFLLHTTLDVPGLAARAFATTDLAQGLRSAAVATAAGALLWTLLALERRRRAGGDLRAALRDEAPTFAPLWLLPALTAAALASVAVRPAFPYGHTLAVALTQDLAPWAAVVVGATVLAARAPSLRAPAPGALSVFFLAWLATVALTPEWARRFDAHPGNEPKYLRMAVALGHRLSFDVSTVTAPMEVLAVRPLSASLAAEGAWWAAQAGELVRALRRGEVGTDAIRAEGTSLLTVRGKDGGTFHSLAPGPAVLLAPSLRVDRALGRLHDTPGALGFTLLAWNALAAAVAAAAFVLARDATGRPGLAALVTAGALVSPPLLFYGFQFYPEVPAALLLAVAFRALAYGRWNSTGQAAALGLALAALPWMHQKFLPVWAVVTALCVLRAVDHLARLPALLALLAPQVATVAAGALYTFAITGSIRPDALYRAAGRTGIRGLTFGQGALGLWLDARYGLLPYAPVFVLAFAGLFLARGRSASLRWAVVPALVYVATVAAADNWTGAISALGRYLLPLVPLGVALAAAALDRLRDRRGAVALALILLSWTLLVGRVLWREPHAANDCALLLQKSAFADGGLYVPSLVLRTWADGPPGLGARLAVWTGLIAVAVAWMARGARGTPPRVLAATVALLLGSAAVLERWPTPYGTPRHAGALPAGDGVTMFVSGPAGTEADHAWATRGTVDVVVRARRPLEALALHVAGEGRLLAGGAPPLLLRSGGSVFALPLGEPTPLRGRRGVEEWLYRATLAIDGPGTVVLRPAAPGPNGPRGTAASPGMMGSRHEERRDKESSMQRVEGGSAVAEVPPAVVRVKDVMSAPVVTVAARASARDALAIMKSRRVQHLVVTGEGGCVEGVLTDGDIRSAQPSVLLVPDPAMRDKALSLVRVADVMTRNPFTVEPEQPARQALDCMLGSKVGSVPVVDHDGHPVGIVTGFDVVKLATRLLG